MKKKRRQFLQTSGTLAIGTVLLPQFACKQVNDSNGNMETNETDEKSNGGDLSVFGIQLYTLRDIIGKDPKTTLKELSELGYKTIEGYEGDQGIFWNMPHAEFNTYINDLGMKFISTHCNIYENFEEKAAQAGEIGMEYLICPYIGAQETMDDWKKIVDKFNECGDICAKNGLKFAYHNHAYSFKPLDGIIPQDYIIENTNPETIDHELDIYWVVTAGVDPIEYIKKYPKRFTLSHVKDRLKNAALEERDASCDLGTGSIDYAQILKVAKDNGMKHFILEQERYDNGTPMEAAAVGASYLKELKFS